MFQIMVAITEQVLEMLYHLSSTHEALGSNLHLDYRNMPIQIYQKIFTTKNTGFSEKYSYIFHISAQNTHCVFLLELPQRGSSNKYCLGVAVLMSTHNLWFF